MSHAKAAIKRVLASAPGWRLGCRVFRPGGVSVLMYHRVTSPGSLFEDLPVETFAAQMRWLRDRCLPIRPEQFHASAGRGKLARPAVLVTFDDGYRDYYTNAFPILKDLEIPAVVFLATEAIDRGGLIWTDWLAWAAAQTSTAAAVAPGHARQTYDLRRKDTRAAFVADTKAHLKTIRDGDRRASLKELSRVLDVPLNHQVLPRQMMSWDEVRETKGLTTLGAHTHTHPIVSRLEQHELEAEIATCRERIESETGEAPRYFAYPNGKHADFDGRSRDIVRSHGFSMAFSTIEGVNGPDTDVMAVKRQPAFARNIPDFAFLVSGMGVRQ